MVFLSLCNKLSVKPLSSTRLVESAGQLFYMVSEVSLLLSISRLSFRFSVTLPFLTNDACLAPTGTSLPKETSLRTGEAGTADFNST